MQTFNFKVEQDYTVQNEPSVVILKFADGYEQTAPKGLNHNLKKYQGITVKANKAEAVKIQQFLNAHGGYKKFNWRDRTSDETVTVRCKSWSSTKLGAVIEFTLNFDEVI
ncbi:TPA: phage tail protein [Mannheimia haemolytica]|nr:phage tail protein [Mannheimia haemolytica]